MAKSDLVTSVIRDITPELIDIRHHLHTHPELSDHEKNTMTFVSEKLTEWNISHKTNVGGYGIAGEVNGDVEGPTILIRADMDALPITEANTFGYCSQNLGVMHACGHDGHTTVLLGTLKTLASMKQDIHGTVKFVFQPAEETVGGAQRMCDEGVMDGVDASVALHGWPGIGLGTIGVRRGAMMASADTFDIVVRGKGSHAAYPHQSVDPIVIGAQIVSALQNIASREANPAEPLVITVTKFHSGTAYNVIPGDAKLSGTIRALSTGMRNELPIRIEAIAKSIAEAHRGSIEFSYYRGTGPVYNDPEFTDFVESVAAETFGEQAIYQVPYSSMGAEDYAAYLEHAPGMMFRLGLGETSPIHTPTFDFDDRAVPIGVEMFTRIALKYLDKGQSKNRLR